MILLMSHKKTEPDSQLVSVVRAPLKPAGRKGGAVLTECNSALFCCIGSQSKDKTLDSALVVNMYKLDLERPLSGRWEALS